MQDVFLGLDACIYRLPFCQRSIKAIDYSIIARSMSIDTVINPVKTSGLEVCKQEAKKPH